MRRLRVKPISCPQTSSLSIRTLTAWVVWTPRMTDSIWGNHNKLNEGSTNNKTMYNRPKGNNVSHPQICLLLHGKRWNEMCSPPQEFVFLLVQKSSLDLGSILTVCAHPVCLGLFVHYSDSLSLGDQRTDALGEQLDWHLANSKTDYNSHNFL